MGKSGEKWNIYKEKGGSWDGLSWMEVFWRKVRVQGLPGWVLLAELPGWFLQIKCVFTYFWLCWVFVAAWAFLWLGWAGLLFTAVCRLLIVVACLLEHGLWDRQAWVVVAHGFSSCSFQALEHKLSSYGAGSAAPRHVGSPWIKDRTEPVFPVLASGFFITEPPGKPQVISCRGCNAHFLRCGLW